MRRSPLMSYSAFLFAGRPVHFAGSNAPSGSRRRRNAERISWTPWPASVATFAERANSRAYRREGRIRTPQSASSASLSALRGGARRAHRQHGGREIDRGDTSAMRLARMIRRQIGSTASFELRSAAARSPPTGARCDAHASRDRSCAPAGNPDAAGYCGFYDAGWLPAARCGRIMRETISPFSVSSAGRRGSMSCSNVR